MTELSSNKPSQITTQVLPLLWHLLSVLQSGNSQSLSSATENLVNALHSILDSDLLAAANANSKVTFAMKELLNDFIDKH